MTLPYVSCRDKGQLPLSLAFIKIMVQPSDSGTCLCRFCKPLDTDLITRMTKEHPIVITVEEGAIGGFGSHGTILYSDWIFLWGSQTVLVPMSFQHVPCSSKLHTEATLWWACMSIICNRQSFHSPWRMKQIVFWQNFHATQDFATF